MQKQLFAITKTEKGHLITKAGHFHDAAIKGIDEGSEAARVYNLGQLKGMQLVFDAMGDVMTRDYIEGLIRFVGEYEASNKKQRES